MNCSLINHNNPVLRHCHSYRLQRKLFYTTTRSFRFSNADCEKGLFRRIVIQASWLTLSSTLLFHLQNYRTCVLPSSGVRTPESNLWSPNYRGRKSELCELAIEKRPLALACIRHRLRHALFVVRCVFEWCDHARTHFRVQFTESERIRKIIWIIFSAINNINSALHLTQTCCIPPERTAAATHRHLDYFW